MRSFALGPVRLGRLAVQFGLAFAAAMIAVGMIGFSLADHWVASRIDGALRYHATKYIGRLEGNPAEDAAIAARISERQNRKVIGERGYVLFDRDNRRLAGRLDIAPPPTGFSTVRFTGGGHHYQTGRALATRLRSGSLFVIVQQSSAAESLHALLPLIVLTISAVAVLLGVSATFLFALLTAKRLAKTQETAAAIAAGDLSRRIPTDRLDGMFAIQAESLNRMLDHMEDLMRSQRLFSSNLAHELRTPLTRLQGLLVEASRDDQSAGSTLVERAGHECGSIIRIFDALLRLAEIEAGRHPNAMAAFPLLPLVEDIADTMEPVLADRGGSLRLARLDDVAIMGDPELIGQLLVNLLENVAAHTPAGTHTTISLEQDGGIAHIVVRDDGPGLPCGELSRVVHPFERGTAASSRNGSGLGLAIAMAIARFHRGSLELRDASPGLEVRLRIPARDRILPGGHPGSMTGDVVAPLQARALAPALRHDISRPRLQADPSA